MIKILILQGSNKNALITTEVLDKINEYKSNKSPDALTSELLKIKECLEILPTREEVQINISSIIAASTTLKELAKIGDIPLESYKFLMLYDDIIKAEIPSLTSILSNKDYNKIIENIIKLHVMP